MPKIDYNINIESLITTSFLLGLSPYIISVRINMSHKIRISPNISDEISSESLCSTLILIFTSTGTLLSVAGSRRRSQQQLFSLKNTASI